MALRDVITGNFVIGQSQTNSILMNENTLVGVIVTGSYLTASEITFLVSDDNTTFYPMYDSSSAELSITTGSYARGYSLDAESFFAWDYIKARQGNSASPVNQITKNIDMKFITKRL